MSKLKFTSRTVSTSTSNVNTTVTGGGSTTTTAIRDADGKLIGVKVDRDPGNPGTTQESSKNISIAEETESGLTYSESSSYSKTFTPQNSEFSQDVRAKPVSLKSDNKKGSLEKNPLEPYNSFNYVITLGCLTNDELNRPELYRDKPPKNLLLRSSGGAGDAKSLTAFELNGNKVEYYIDNLEIRSVISPNPESRNTNATGISFDVIEPYSMGLLLQSMEICALRAGHRNYLEAPWLLTIEFRGYDEDGNTLIVPNTKRQFPIKLVGAQFGVSAGGSQYEVKAVPFNEGAFSDLVQALPVDVKLTGNNLNEITQTGINSLSAAVNTFFIKQYEQNIEKTGIGAPDEYIFIFPQNNDNDSFWEGVPGQDDVKEEELLYFNRNRDYDIEEVYKSIRTGNFENKQAIEQFVDEQYGFTLKRGILSENIKQRNEVEANINDIGKKKIKIENPLDAGTVPFGQQSFAFDSETGILKKGKTEIDPKKRVITFKKGMMMQRVLEELVLISDFGENVGKVENGFINWFRIETNVFNLYNPKWERKTGRPPRIYLYKVLPYKVHQSLFTLPNTPVAGYKEIEDEICKEYNYIYTGKNKDVLEFDIQLKTAFFAAHSPDMGNQGQNNNASSGGSYDDEFQVDLADSPDNLQGDGMKLYQTLSNDSQSAGAIKESAEVQVARRFQQAVVQSNSDLIVADMTIMGDPYYIADSGMGNYNSRPLRVNINENGSMSYQNGQVDVRVNFRTPVDIRANDGMYDFGTELMMVDQFSGLYMVTNVTNNLSGGEFKQQLRLVRRQKQKLKEEATDDSKSMLQAKESQDKKIQEAKEKGDSRKVAELQADTNFDGKVDALEAANAEQKNLLRPKESLKSKINIKDVDQAGRIRGGL